MVDESEHINAAHHEFLLKSTIPILIEEMRDGKLAMGVQGHGTLYQINGRLYLVTAGHVIQDIKDWDRVGVPTKPDPGQSFLWPFLYEHVDVLTFFTAQTHVATHLVDGIDIGLIEIRDAVLADVLRNNYMIHTENSLLPIRSKFESLIALATPTTEASRDMVAGLVGPRPMLIETVPLLHTPDRNPEDQTVPSIYDRHLMYGEWAHDKNGKQVRAPALGGISGCGIWAKVPSNGDKDKKLWLPSLKMHLVDTSFRPRSHITGQRVEALVAMFKKIDPVGAAILETALSTQEPKHAIL